MMELEIRDAEPSDLEALTDLPAELFPTEADDEIDLHRRRRGLARLMDGCHKHGCIKVAVADGRVVGMCSAQTLVCTEEGGTAALVGDMVVAKSWRGRGIGRQLIGSVCSWAGLRGVTRLQLLVDHTNQAAMDFYAKAGWRTTRLVCLRKRL